MYGYFKWKTGEIACEKTCIWWWKENLKRETEFLLIAAQNNTIRTNYIKVKIDYRLQNNKCRLHDGRHETLNHIISEGNKLWQKTRHDWVWKVIHWELCKKVKLVWNGICTNQNLFLRKRCMKFFRISRY